MKNITKNLSKLFFVVSFGLITTALFAAPPRTVSSTSTNPSGVVSPTDAPKTLDAKSLKLSPAAAITLQKWKTTKNMQLTSDGNFVPLKHPVPTANKISTGNNTGTNNPSGAKDVIICAKIPCPDVFGPGVECWECH